MQASDRKNNRLQKLRKKKCKDRVHVDKTPQRILSQGNKIKTARTANNISYTKIFQIRKPEQQQRHCRHSALVICMHNSWFEFSNKSARPRAATRVPQLTSQTSETRSADADIQDILNTHRLSNLYIVIKRPRSSGPNRTTTNRGRRCNDFSFAHYILTCKTALI